MADTILKTIADYAKVRVEQAKTEVPLEEMKARALEAPQKEKFGFEKALSKEDIGFICECKKASPSKGLIASGSGLHLRIDGAEMVSGREPLSERDHREREHPLYPQRLYGG